MPAKREKEMTKKAEKEEELFMRGDTEEPQKEENQSEKASDKKTSKKARRKKKKEEVEEVMEDRTMESDYQTYEEYSRTSPRFDEREYFEETEKERATGKEVEIEGKEMGFESSGRTLSDREKESAEYIHHHDKEEEDFESKYEVKEDERKLEEAEEEERFEEEGEGLGEEEYIAEGYGEKREEYEEERETDVETEMSEEEFEKARSREEERGAEAEEEEEEESAEEELEEGEGEGEREESIRVEFVEEEEEGEEAVVLPPRKKYIPPRLKELAEFEEGGVKYILLNKVSTKTISELIRIAKDLKIPDPSSMRRQELIAEILSRANIEYGFHLYAEGVFQSIDTGSGFMRFPHNNYLQSSDDVFVSKTIIKKYGLRDGDVVAGEIKPPKEDKGKYFSLHSVKKINFTDPWKARERNLFENLTPYYPNKKFMLDWQPDGDISCRVVDIIAPIGKGQRGLIVSPPRAGKTMLLQNIAKAILTNHPEVILIVLLIDERPEEVTDWKRNIIGKYSVGRRVEVVASTFDERPETHIKVAEIVLAKAKRLVEYKYDVVIFLDSITRLTRAYNQYVPSSGKVLTGGIDSAALQFPKKFFGAARAIEGGGSLTILATCLIDTGSRMDEVIFEEFKGTGNMEIYLDRRIAEKRIFPAIDVHRSGTRREELLHSQDTLAKIWLLRKVLQPLSTIDAMETLYEKMSRTKTNTEFFNLMASEG